MQINIIKKVLNQIPLSQHGKQQPLFNELTDFIATHPHLDIETVLGEPSSLVGKKILHKFQVNSGEES